MNDDDAAQARLAREAPAGLFEVSPEGAILVANAGFEALTGRPAHELVGTRFREHLTPASQILYALKVETALFESGEVREVLLDVAHRDGRPRAALLTTRARPGNGARCGVLFPAPERRAHERELVVARGAAENAAETRARFLATVSHELRTPLNGVLGITSLIEGSPARTFSREYADIIAQSARRLETIVDDILDFASLDADETTFEAQPVDVADLVGGVCDQVRAVAQERGLTLTFEVEPAARGVFLADPRRLRQILRPLLSNAIKFTSVGGVTVRLAPATAPFGEPGLRLSVADTGAGLDPRDFARLTSPFEQGDSSNTRRFGGVGLGLAIAKSLAEHMGGRLSVTSAPGEGSCFTVEWPAARGRDEELKSREPPPPGAARPASVRGLHILCAEDDLMNRMLVEALAEELGHAVTVVEDGAAALDRLEAERFDLVLMDMQMPVMDGLAATRELRRRERDDGGPRMPVIMLTANSMPDDVTAALAAGVDRHLAKPITAQYLQAAIVETLRDAARDQGADPATPT